MYVSRINESKLPVYLKHEPSDGSCMIRLQDSSMQHCSTATAATSASFNFHEFYDTNKRRILGSCHCTAAAAVHRNHVESQL